MARDRVDDVLGEANRGIGQQKFDIMNSDEYRQDMVEAEEMLRTLRGKGQMLDENGNPINITEQEIVDFMENKYSPISKDVTNRLQPLKGERTF